MIFLRFKNVLAYCNVVVVNSKVAGLAPDVDCGALYRLTRYGINLILFAGALRERVDPLR
jgi:hypothetical protein